MNLKIKLVLLALVVISISSYKQKEKLLTNSKSNQYSKFISEMKSKGITTGNIWFTKTEKLFSKVQMV